VERAQETVDTENAEKLEKKIRRNMFTLQDFLEQLRQIKKMGPLGDLISMIPGMGNKLSNVEFDNKSVDKIEAIICSMTRVEREKPFLIDGQRRRRIASGSGSTVQDVNKLLKQFDTIKVMMKRMNKIAGKRGQAAAMRSLSPF
jgi:signal recognition particle subunit SRP54